ncbi:diguanylate cyclase (GGDEF)-like protein [Granulicella aggregans]|uniref:diguanylate cyclase n=1 Tax=Granulicella aggregans TaxID=474949 RepID=A0A7W7ZHU4_9BACT|nr:sensor domain-containing diguanylate cyclase [Granulicella aggregans]MBB5060172.1 diguanylate cyclase (GGDEF)-like protein [Granulicella aggregans]
MSATMNPLLDAFPADLLPDNEEKRLQVLDSYGILDTDDEQAYDDLTHLATVLCNAPTALVTLIDRDRQWVKSRVNWERRQDPRDASFCAHAILRPGQIMEVPDATDDSRFMNNELVTGKTGVRFYAGVPLVTKEGAALGTICVLDRRPRMLTRVQSRALESLARQVVTQLELRLGLAELEKESMSDPLTGVWNRRALFRLLRNEWARHSRSGQRIAILMVDIDHFKSINDSYGHPRGDAVLQEVAKTLSSNLRPSDSLFRYGGEEFCCVLTDCDLEAAKVVAERARCALESSLHAGIEVTVSIGASTALPAAHTSSNLLMARADAALYLAKQAGRNQVVLSDE